MCVYIHLPNASVVIRGHLWSCFSSLTFMWLLKIGLTLLDLQNKHLSLSHLKKKKNLLLFSVYECIACIIYVYVRTTCVPGALGETFVPPCGC